MINLVLKNMPIRDQVNFGTDWGAAPKVVAAKGDKELWHLPGFNAWNGRGEDRVYEPCRFMLVALPKGRFQNIKELTLETGARLSKKLVEKHRSKIEDFFGEKTTY